MANICLSRGTSLRRSEPEVPDMEIDPAQIIQRNGYNKRSSSLTQYENVLKLESQLGFLRTPQQLQTIRIPDADLENSNQHKNSFLIVPFLNLFHWVLLVPYRIEYKSTQFCKKTNLLLTTLSYISLICILAYMLLLLLYDVREPYSVKVIIDRAAWTCYTVFDIVVITSLRMKGENLSKLFTEGSQICNLMDKINALGRTTPQSRNYTKVLICLVCGLSITYTMFFVTYIISEMTASSTSLYNSFLNMTSRPEHMNETTSSSCASEKEVLCNLMERFSSSIFASSLLIFWFFMAFSVEMIWVVFLIMTAFCGHYFKRMFTDCINIMQNGKVDTREGIKIYIKISEQLEEFNNIFGHTLLWIVIASILYVSVTVGDFLAGNTNGLGFDITNVLGFTPFIVMLFSASELHKTGHVLPSIIKKQFLDIEKQEQTMQMDIIQGTTLIQYDSLSNNIGLKGAGFFTISYGFVGNMVGVIITYSLITVQFKIGELKLQ